MNNGTLHEKDFFDLSGSLSFKEQQALARWYSYSLLLLVFVVINMFVFSGRALYKNFWSLSSAPELLPESLEEIRTRYIQKTELYNQREMHSFSKNHELINNALSCVVDSLPDGVQLSKISFENNKVTITGLGENSSVCMEFVEALKRNNCFKEYIVHTITWHSTELHRREIKISFLV
jgi:Tfp pilus assembly protein PilN